MIILMYIMTHTPEIILSYIHESCTPALSLPQNHYIREIMLSYT